MAQDIARWQPQRTTFSIASEVEASKQAVSLSTSPIEAVKAAKQLVGSYAHMKPGDPDTFIAAISAVLAQYPLGVVNECCDPRTGIARTAKFLSVAELVEWLDERLKYRLRMADHIPRPLAPPVPAFTEEHKATMRAKIAELFHWMAGRPDPISKMKTDWRKLRAPTVRP
jgi:hypothetical protein